MTSGRSASLAGYVHVSVLNIFPVQSTTKLVTNKNKTESELKTIKEYTNKHQYPKEIFFLQIRHHAVTCGAATGAISTWALTRT